MNDNSMFLVLGLGIVVNGVCMIIQNIRLSKSLKELEEKGQAKRD